MTPAQPLVASGLLDSCLLASTSALSFIHSTFVNSGMYASGKGYLTVIVPFGVSIYTGKVYLEGFVLVLLTQNFRPPGAETPSSVTAGTFFFFFFTIVSFVFLLVIAFGCSP